MIDAQIISHFCQKSKEPVAAMSLIT